MGNYSITQHVWPKKHCAHFEIWYIASEIDQITNCHLRLSDLGYSHGYVWVLRCAFSVHFPIDMNEGRWANLRAKGSKPFRVYDLDSIQVS